MPGLAPSLSFVKEPIGKLFGSSTRGGSAFTRHMSFTSSDFTCSNGAKLAVTSSCSMRSAPRMGTIPTGPSPPSVTVWRWMSRPSQETLSWSPTRSIASSNGFFPLTCISDFMTRPVSRSVRTSGPETEKSPLIPEGSRSPPSRRRPRGLTRRRIWDCRWRSWPSPGSCRGQPRRP